jgi:hypothetical protein
VTSSAVSVGFFFFFYGERHRALLWWGSIHSTTGGWGEKNHMWALFHPTVLADLFHMIIWAKSFQDGLKCSFVLQSNDVANNVRSFFVLMVRSKHIIFFSGKRGWENRYSFFCELGE